MFAVTYAIPLITDRDYVSCHGIAGIRVAFFSICQRYHCGQGYGQLENSYIFLALTLTSLASTSVIAFASKHASDRDLLCLFQIISWSGLITYTLVSGFGANRLAVGWFVLLLVWFTFGNSGPMTQGIYSKLIGRGNAGLYFSVLQSNGAISRVVSGQLVGLAYGGLGAAWVWCSVHLLWCLQWAAFLSLWSAITPEAIATMHERLAEEEEQAAPTGTRWVQRVELQRMLEKLGAHLASFLCIFPNAC